MKIDLKEIYFEESMVDGLVDGFSKLEKPLNNKIFWAIIFLISCIFLVTIGRIFYLIIIKGVFYQTRALVNINKTITIPSQRGLITDRLEKLLLKNTSSFNVVLDLNSFLQPDNRPNLNLALKELELILGVAAEELIQKLKNTNIENNDKLILARDISVEQAINVKTLNLVGIEIIDDYKRNYFKGSSFSSVLGYLGIGERNNQIAGVVGIESYYDSFLRGQDGEQVILRDVRGKNIDKKIFKEAKTGNKIILTIDGDFQEYFYNRLQLGLKELGRMSGVGLAINPQTGEVLAMISLPSFDNNQPAKFLNAENQPLFNRAISGVYSPGSTIKPLVALAAIREKVVTPEWQTYSNGYLELANPFDPERPSRFLDWRAHGWVDLHSALARSSNVYFYIVGGGFGNIKGLGINRLKEYWSRFDFDQLTGVDLDGEAVGFLPDPEEKEKRTGQIWRIGDTYNVSIGQGDLAITPLRLLTFIASLANGGKTLQPFLVKKIVNEKDEIIKENQPVEIFDYSDWKEEIKEVQKGLRDTVAQPYGTANLLYDLPYKTAAKTGSAQVANNTKTNAFFVGYGPYDNPQIAILVLVENAKEGSINTLPIAYDVMKWYYQNRL
jgi:penicillin-binding protein 2